MFMVSVAPRSFRIVASLAVFALSAFALAACGGDSPASSVDEPDPAVLGIQGGRVDFGPGLSLEVPAGALDGDVRFTVDTLAAPSGHADTHQLGDVYRFGPTWVAASAPIRVTLPVPAGSPQVEELLMLTLDAGGEVVGLDDERVDVAVVSARTQRLGDTWISTSRRVPITLTTDPQALELSVGEGNAIEAQALNPARREIPDAAIQWHSAAPEIASVSADGVVQAHRPGDADITASLGGFEAQTRVTVRPGPPAELLLIHVPSVMVSGDSVRVDAEVRDASGELLPDAAVTWSVSAPEVLTLATGPSLIAGNAGMATVTASTENGIDAQVTVQVVLPAPELMGIRIVPATVELVSGSEATLVVEAVDAEGGIHPLPGSLSVAVASANSEVVGVQVSGGSSIVLEGRRVGMVVITVEAGEWSVEADVQVTPGPPVSVRIVSPAPNPVVVQNDTLLLAAEVRDTWQNVVPHATVWTSSHPDLMEVLPGARARAVAAGAAWIHVRATPTLADSVNVTVEPFVPTLPGTPILYERVAGSDLTLHVVAPDGSGGGQVAVGVHPTWVGGTIVARGAFQDNRLYRMNADGSNRTLIFGSTPSYAPDLSWDGARIVFVHGNCTGGHRIVTTNADGSGLQILGPCGERPRWSPDGARIAYLFGGNIHVMDADGSNSSVVVENVTTGEAYGLSWAPTGDALVFARGGALWTHHLSSGEERAITAPFEAVDARPDWSPDGEWMLFSSDRGGSSGLWLLHLSSGHLAPVTSADGTAVLSGVWRR